MINLTFVINNLGDEEIIRNFIYLNDIKALKSKIEFADCEIAFFKLFGIEDPDNFFNEKKVGIDSNRELKLKESGSSSNKKYKPFSTLTNIAHYFKDNQNLKPFYPLLFGPFKFLSQVEHYTFENRSFSFFRVELMFFLSKVCYKL